MVKPTMSVIEDRLPAGRVVYAVMPPHAPRGFTSVTKSGAIGVSFSGHRLAARGFATAPARESDIPAGAAFLTISADLEWLNVTEPSEAWEFHPQPGYVQQVASELGASRPVTIADVDGRPDPVIWAIAAAFRASLRRGWPMDALRAGERLHAMTAHVVHRYGGIREKDRRTGLLEAHRLGRVVEYIDGHLADRIVLEDLAGAAALSPFHFARSFRATTQLTPYGFVTARRMERARQLLTGTPRRSADIASQVGYANVAHFREQFVRAFGVRPAELRAGRTPDGP